MYNQLTQSTGLENISSTDLELLIQRDNDCFGKAARERNRRMFQEVAPLINSLSIKMNTLWNDILSVIPFAVMNIEKDDKIKLELNDITFLISSSKAFPAKIEIKVSFLGFTDSNFINLNEVVPYIETILLDIQSNSNEPTEQEKEAYCYYQTLEMKEAMSGLSEIDLYNLRF